MTCEQDFPSVIVTTALADARLVHEFALEKAMGFEVVLAVGIDLLTFRLGLICSHGFAPSTELAVALSEVDADLSRKLMKILPKYCSKYLSTSNRNRMPTISTLKELAEAVVKPPEAPSVVVKCPGAGAPLLSQPSQLDAALLSQGADAALPSNGEGADADADANTALPSQATDADAALPSQVVYVSVC